MMLHHLARICFGHLAHRNEKVGILMISGHLTDSQAEVEL